MTEKSSGLSTEEILNIGTLIRVNNLLGKIEKKEEEAKND
jgi:hypothetical protein